MTGPAKTYNVIVTRVLDAPVERAWAAWRDPEYVKQWWGPTGFTCPLAEMDFREGGTSLVCMRAPAEYGGQDVYSTWTYTTIVPNERIDYVFNFADKNGGKLSPAEAGIEAGVPQDGRHVVRFRDLGAGQTELTVTEHGYTVEQARDQSQAGLEQCIDKLAESLQRQP
jgi:uncharacterized protein YndB with AHSA1/START domain